MTEKQTAGRDALSGFADEFARLNDDVLFGEEWARTDKLSLRDRSLVTVVSLVAQGITDSSLEYHFKTALKNGITREEIAEILTHAAFYVGWPKVWSALRTAKGIWPVSEKENEDLKNHLKSMIFPLGAPNKAYAEYFTGNSYLAPLATRGISVCNVTFEPACRNNWHIHKADKGGGQILICVAGRGLYREWGHEAVMLGPGDTVSIKPGIKHWHGATKNSWFSHLAVEIPGENACSEWLEAVGDDEYDKANKGESL